MADTISHGTQVTMLALPLIAVLVLDATEIEVGLFVATQSLPFLLLGLPAVPGWTGVVGGQRWSSVT